MDEREEALKLVEKYKEWYVIVEGTNDKKALEKLGFTHIVTYKKPAYYIAEMIAHWGVKEVVLLMDLDKAGRKKYGELKTALTRQGIRVQDALRNFLLKHTTVSHIEGLHTYLS